MYLVKHVIIIRAPRRDVKILVESTEVVVSAHLDTKLYIKLVIMCSDFGAARKFLGRVCTGVKGSIDLY